MARPRPAWTPPMRDGVSPSRVALTPGPWTTVWAFLCERLPAVSPREWQARLAAGEVLSDSGEPVHADTPCRAHRTLWYWRWLDQPEAPIPFEVNILWRDEHLLVVDKPHFLPMTPKGRYLQETLLVRLKRLTGLADLVPLHRLDRETAGVVLLSVQPSSRAAYQNLFRDRQIHKVYEAVAPWRPALGHTFPMTRHTRLEERAEAFMQMHECPGEPNACTHIDVLEVSEAAGLARYRLAPVTGRKHQLRAHMHALGLPLVGDRIYPQLLPQTPPGEAEDFSEPLRLLARDIAFTDPLSAEPRRFSSTRQLSLQAPLAPSPITSPTS